LTLPDVAATVRGLLSQLFGVQRGGGGGGKHDAQLTSNTLQQWRNFCVWSEWRFDKYRATYMKKDRFETPMNLSSFLGIRPDLLLL